MSDIVKEYYNKTVQVEWSRMERHPLEFEITKKHIDQYLKPNCRILDVGGGPGRYSFHYAQLGYKVTLLDLSDRNIYFAREKQKELNIFLEDTIIGNALDMSYIATESFDVVLCMGPLYHLVTENEQMQVIEECKRIVKKDGIIVFTFITEMAQAISLIRSQPNKILEYEYEFHRAIETGLNNVEFDVEFTKAFFIDPLKVEEYIKKNDLNVLKIAGAEGFACMHESAIKKLSNTEKEKWIDFSFKYSEKKSLLGACQHLLCIANKL